MKALLEGFARHRVFANLLLVMIFFLGIAASILMVRRVLPPIELDMIRVAVPYPGAGPEEVEEGINLRIEDALANVTGIKKFTTIAAEGMATALIEVADGHDTQVVKDRVADSINAISDQFPEDSERPSIAEILTREETLRVAIVGDIPERQLKELAEEIKDEIIALPGVSLASVSGTRPFEISIEVSEEMLRKYRLTLQDVAGAVRAASLNLPGGSVRAANEEINIRTLGRMYTGREYEEVIVATAPDGAAIRVRDIGTVRDGFIEDILESRFNGRPAATVVVSNTEDEDGLLVSAAVRRYIEQKRLEMPDTVELHIWADASAFISERLELLIRSGLVGLMLVFFFLWMALDLRLAFWVSLAIPVSIAGGLALVYPFGQTINMISMFAMILVLGILVDDAIVVGESIYVHRKSGKKAIRAAVDGTWEVGMPVTAAVTTTCVAFVPLFFVSGVMGEFISVIPAVVIAALLISLLECLVILPAHLNNLPDLSRKPQRAKWNLPEKFGDFVNARMEWMVSEAYRPFLAWLLGWRYATLAASVATLLVTMGLVQGGIVKFVFFDTPDTDFLQANIEFSEGTPVGVTRTAVERIEDALRQVAEETPTLTGEPMIRGLESNVGGQRVMDIVPRMSVASHKGQVVVELLGSESRGVLYSDLVAKWEAAIGPIPGVQSLTISGETGGPPGAPVEVWLKGQDLEMLQAASARIREELRGYAGVFQIEDDFRPGKRELRAELRPEARNLGLTTADLAMQLRAGFYGEEALRVQRGRDEVRVWVRYPLEQRRRLDDFEAVKIRTRDGREVPLASVAEVRLEEGYTTITRVDGQRRIAVTAEVNNAVTNADEVLRRLRADVLDSLAVDFPGVAYDLEGQQAQNIESMASLKVGFPLALFGIYLLLATMFRSYIQPALIMVAVPFGIIGAVWGHLLMGYSLSIMSMFGIVALTGVVVNGAIILIEAINVRIGAGLTVVDAIIDGAARRFRPITLTTLTTIGGLTPLLMERSMQAQFLIPMALTVAAGVAFATVITLIMLPCLLYILNDIRRGAHWLVTGVHPTPEEVEPARHRDVDDIDIVGPGAPPPSRQPVY